MSSESVRPQPVQEQEVGLQDFGILAWLEYAYLLRFPIISALLLSIGLPILYFVVPSIFKGLFDARGGLSFGFITWITLTLAWTIMATARLILVYAPDRFPELVPVRLRSISFSTTLKFAILAVPCIILLFRGSEDLHFLNGLIAVAAGSLAAVAMLFLAALIHFELEPHGRQTAKMVVPSFGFLHSEGRLPSLRFQFQPKFSPAWSELSSGLMDQNRVRSGHVAAAVRLALLTVAYIAIGIAFRPSKVAADNQPAALFYALFLITLLAWLTSGLGFFLDRFRIPVLTTALFFSLVTGMIHTDHKFRIDRLAQQPSYQDLSPSGVIKSWTVSRGDPHKPVVVVATAGGGIQAAAWTAQVLTGVQRDCGEKFSSSLLLVSSVSGGSAGAMYFLAAYNGESGAFSPDPRVLQEIEDNASRSSLSAIGWGLLYPDLLRTVPVAGTLVPETFDRGWALENAWITGWKQPPNISDWRANVAQGRRPAVIFNATAAESGQRFVTASTDTKDNPGVVQFAKSYAGWDMPVATAARLSATFPFVSPITRASTTDKSLPRFHVADGGYYDNSGVLSAVDWLDQAIPELNGHEVILLMIDGSASEAKAGQTWAWQRQLSGPLETILHVRTSSQRYRDDLESRLAVKALLTEHITLHPIHFNFPYSETPLSWHLNRSQRDKIIEGWADRSLANSKTELGTILRCSIQ